MPEGNKDMPTPEQGPKKSFSNNSENKKAYGKNEDIAETDSNWTEYGVDSYEQAQIRYSQKRSGDKRTNQSNNLGLEKDKILTQDNSSKNKLNFQEEENNQKENRNDVFGGGKGKTNFFWLTTEEEVNQITGPRTKRFISGLAKLPPEQLDPRFLLDQFGHFQNLVQEENLTLEEIEPFEFRILAQHKILKKQEADNDKKSMENLIGAFTDAQKKQYSEIEYGLPESKNIGEQRKFIERYLDIIENSNRDCLDFSISARVTALESNLDRMDDSVKNDVEARIALHDCTRLQKQANGTIKQRDGQGLTVGSAATMAEINRNHGLDRKKIVWLLTEYDDKNKVGIPGLKIGQAWNYFQSLNDPDFYSARIHEINKEIKELKLQFPEKDFEESEELNEDKRETVFFTDSDGKRKSAIKELIIRKLGGDVLARKSFQLAEKLTIATLETSVFNRNAGIGNDELADIIGFKRWRDGREKSGRDRGPEIHEGKIDGIGSSFLRFTIRKIEETKIEMEEVNGKMEEVKKTIKIKTKFHENQDKDETMIPILAEDIIKGQKEIQEGAYSYFCAVKVGRIAALSELLLDLSPKPGSINKASLQKAIAYFDLVDKGIINEKEEKMHKNKFKANKDKMDPIMKEIDQEIDKIKKDRLLTEEEEGKERFKIQEKKVQEVFDKFEAKFEKYGDKKLRLRWIEGVVDQALGDFYLEWDANAFLQLKKAVTQDVLSEQKGTFLDPEHWDYIMKATRFHGRFATLVSDRFKANFKPKF